MTIASVGFKPTPHTVGILCYLQGSTISSSTNSSACQAPPSGRIFFVFLALSRSSEYESPQRLIEVLQKCCAADSLNRVELKTCGVFALGMQRYFYTFTFSHQQTIPSSSRRSCHLRLL